MSYEEDSGFFLKSPKAIAIRLDQDPTWLEGLGALEVYDEDVSRIFSSNELPYSRDYNPLSSVIQRLSYIRKGVLIAARRVPPKSFIKAFASADPNGMPFVHDHYSKIFSPDAEGGLSVLFSAYQKKGSSQDPIHHAINDDSFVVEDVDILGLKSEIRIVLVGVNRSFSAERKAYLLLNSHELGKTDFKPKFGILPNTEDYDIRCLEGFTNEYGDVVYLFIDAKTKTLMALINDDKPVVVLKDVKVLFRAATGSEIRDNHLTTALTETLFVDLRFSRKPLMVNTDVWLRNSNPELESLFQTACSMNQPVGVTAPHGMFIVDKGCSNVLIYRHRPAMLRRLEIPDPPPVAEHPQPSNGAQAQQAS